MNITNLLKETIADLADYGKGPADVRWVGSADGSFALSWDAFIPLGVACNYDCDYGAQNIASDLVVVGDDWWLERHEYDGAEYWDFKQLPTCNPSTHPFELVANGDNQATIAEMNRPGGKYGMAMASSVR